ncbi:hypothetical protein AB3S75_039041 [Citrus x aurantiifolia]
MGFLIRLILCVLSMSAFAMASARNTIPLPVSGNKELLAMEGRSLKMDIDDSCGSSTSNKVSVSLMAEVLDYHDPGPNPGHTPPAPPNEVGAPRDNN